MSGYASRKEGFKGIHDPISARALVLSDGARTAAIVTWELIGIPTDVWEALSQRIAKETGSTTSRVRLRTAGITTCRCATDRRISQTPKSKTVLPTSGAPARIRLIVSLPPNQPLTTYEPRLEGKITIAFKHARRAKKEAQGYETCTALDRCRGEPARFGTFFFRKGYFRKKSEQRKSGKGSSSEFGKGDAGNSQYS